MPSGPDIQSLFCLALALPVRIMIRVRSPKKKTYGVNVVHLV